jgi:hypothetical protein
MTQTKQTLKNTSRVWKRGDDWVQHNPPRHHPCYEEWMKQREKEKYNDK